MQRYRHLIAVAGLPAAVIVITAIAAPPGSRTGAPPAPGDLTGAPGTSGVRPQPGPAVPAPPCNAVVGIDTVINIVLNWGTCPPGPNCDGDFNNDGLVDVDDVIGAVLGWGWCEPALKIGPVPGLTTAWHDAPPSVTVPVDTMLYVHQMASEDAVVTWTGAVEIERTESGSTAACPIDATAPHEIRADVDQVGPDGPLHMTFTCIVHGSTISIADIEVGTPTIVTGSLDVDETLDEPSLNALTTDLFFGPSIAAIRDVGNGLYRTSIGRPVPFTVQVDPPEFRALMEWRIDGAVVGIGPAVTRSFEDIGVRQLAVAVGPSVSPATITADIETYAVTITSHDDEIDLLFEDQEYLFTAETDPPGYEDEITWLSSTKYGTGDPVLGTGPQFSVRFAETFGLDPVQGVWQWLGVKADHAAFNQDQKAPGACCLGINACQFIAQIECEMLDGFYEGDGVPCDSNACEFLQTGACCRPDGICFVVSPIICGAFLGIYEGSGTTCAEATCPPGGACCLGPSDCMTAFETDCVAAGGVFEAENVSCDEFACPPAGACCVPGEGCTITVDELDCLTILGTFLGEGAPCALETCPVRACCIDDDICLELTEFACNSAGGLFQPDAVDCFDVICPPGGACCLPTAPCTILDEITCLANCGIFLGIGTYCSVPCPPVYEGACCLDGDECVVTSCQTCLVSGGAFGGTDTACDQDGCPDIPVGACCVTNFNGDQCFVVSIATCDALGGAFEREGTTCDPNPCP